MAINETSASAANHHDERPPAGTDCVGGRDPAWKSRRSSSMGIIASCNIAKPDHQA